MSQVSATVVVVRVEEDKNGENEDGVDSDDATLLNIIGETKTDGSYTGAYAFLATKSLLGVAPRILIAPKFSSEEAVTTELISIANRLRAIVIADAPNGSNDEIVKFVKSCTSPRLYVLYPEVVNSKGENVPTSPYAAGVIAKSDNENGFWVSPSNKTISGIVGLSKAVDFSLGDVACKANYLNEQHVATIINQDGYRLWGNRSTAQTGSYKFLCVQRTADIISDSILQAHLWAVDRNIVKNYLTDVVESVNAFLADLKSRGAILAGKCFANKELNTAANIADGKVFFDFEFTPAYPAEQVTFRAYLKNDDIESLLLENLGQ